MSEGEVIALRNDIKQLSEKTDRLHEANQRDREKDRQMFETAMQQQRSDFQTALNVQFVEHTQLEKKVDTANTLLRLAVGTGATGEGRVGQLEKGFELLQKFRWQATAVIALLLLLADHFQQLVKAVQ